MVEHLELAIDVERCSVHGPASPSSVSESANSHRSDLARVVSLGIDPDPGVACQSANGNSVSAEFQFVQSLDDHGLEAMNVGGPGTRDVIDRHDRIEDELSRTVVGDVPTTIRVHQLRPYRFWSNKYVGRIGTNAHSVHRRVLEHEQVIVHGSRCQGMLKGESLSVRHTAQATNAQHLGA